MSPQTPDAQEPDSIRVDRQVEEFLRNVPRPMARVEFRESLRRDFLAISASESARDPAPAPARTPFRYGWALAAAFLVALGFLLFRSPAPRWEVLDLAPGSLVRADGAVVPPGDATELANVLRRAREIHVEGGDLIVRVGDLALFDFGAGTRVNMPDFAGTSGQPIQLRVSSGRLRARTGPAFRGRTMRVETDLFDVAVTGTAFAVDFENHGTCICCLHGEVTMSCQSVPSGPEVIPPEHMCLIWREEPGREPKRGPPPPPHGDPLRRLEARAREIWPER